MGFSHSVKKQWSDLLLGDFTPHCMALGLAIGTFIALLPTFGFSVLLAILLAFLFPKMNRPAIFFALLVWNPIVQIPIYALSFNLGGFLFDGLPQTNYSIEILNQIYNFTKRFLVAHLIITTVTTLVVYFLTKYLLTRKS